MNTLHMAGQLALSRIRNARGHALLDALAVLAFSVSSWLLLTTAGGVWMFYQRLHTLVPRLAEQGIPERTTDGLADVYMSLAVLALGLLMGIGLEPLSLAIGLSALLLVIMFVVDHSKLMTTLRSQTIIVDRAISDEDELKAYLSSQLGYSIENATIAELDLINDKTVANIRYTVGESKKSLPASTGSLSRVR